MSDVEDSGGLLSIYSHTGSLNGSHGASNGVMTTGLREGWRDRPSMYLHIRELECRFDKLAAGIHILNLRIACPVGKVDERSMYMNRSTNGDIARI